MIVSVGNLKGGVGKSSITVMLATYLYSVKKKRVLVIDSDDTQQTIAELRQKEIDNGCDEDTVFHVLSANSTTTPELLEGIVDDYDYIFIDLPGNLKQKGVISCYTMTDLFFIPTSLSDEDLDSTIKFYSFLKKEVVPARNSLRLKTSIYGILSQVSKRSIEYKEFLNTVDELPFSFLSEPIPYSETFRRKTSSEIKIDHHSKSFDTDVWYKDLNKILKTV